MSIRATAQYTITDLNDATEIVKDFYGESSILNKSGNSNFKEFNLLGNSKQKITSLGNNLLDSSFSSFSMNGITATYNNDTQELTINGTCTKNNTGLSFSHFTKVNLKTNEKLYAKVKYVSGSCTGGASSGFGIFNSDWTKNVVILLNGITGDLTRVFTADSDISISRAQIRFDKGDIYNNLKIKLMVSKSNIAYTNFIPNSPSIDYPSENKSVGDNKNLIIETSSNLWYNTDTNSLITSSNVASVIAKVPKNCDITISKKNGSNRFAVLTCTNKPASGVTFKQIFIDNENLNRKTYTFKNTDGEYLWIGLCNSTINEDKKKALEEVKVETGTIVTPYSPFGNGNININVCNKNLVDYRKLSLWKRTTGWNMSSMQISDGIIKINNTKAWDVFSIYDKRFINKKISITGEIRYTKKSDNFWGVIVTTNKYSDYPKINPSLNTWTEFSHTITSNGYIGFCIRGKDDDTVGTEIEIRNIAISFDNPIEYIPHEEQNYTIDTQEPFRAIGDIRDCFVLKENGKWYERHKVGEKIFNGTENWIMASAQPTNGIKCYYQVDFDYLYEPLDNRSLQNKSNILNAITNNDYINYTSTGFNIVSQGINICLLNTNITSLEEWKEYLNKTNMKCLYPLGTPIDIECTSRQQEQLDILTKNSYTYEDTTILSSIDEIPSILSGKYYTYYKGNLSVGVRTVRVDYQVSSNGVDIPTGTWESQIPLTQPSQFLWTRTTTYFTDNTTKVSYSISRNGTNGTTARTYWLSSSTSTVNRSMSKILKPSTITFNSYYRDGTSAINTSYAGRFIIQESSDGKSWTTKYTSSANESSKTYTPTSTTSIVKCTMYVAGGTTTALDTTTVNIVDSIDDLRIGGNNLFPNGGLSKGNNTSMEYNKNTYTYTITAPVVTNTFGAGVNLNRKILVPFGKDYRVSCEVYCNTLHRLIVDHNNEPASGNAWSGNDNDYGPDRVGVIPSTIPANTWTKVYWGGSNRNANNTNKVDLVIYDHLGIITKDDTQPITWKVRKVQVEIGNVVTEWTPYLEDMDKRIDDAKNSADTANNKFDNLQIGGKNYLKGTRDLSGANVKRTIESEKYLDFTVTSYTTSETSGYMDVLKWVDALEIKPNTEYCLSFYAKGKGTLESFLYPDAVESGTNSDNYNIISSDGRSFLTLTETWKRYWIKWKTKDTAEGLKGVIVGRLTNTTTSGNQSVYLCGPMLEESNTPSDWSPAPEDINNKVDNMKIGGRNLIIGSSAYQKDTPFTHSSNKKDGIAYIPATMYMPCKKGETYIFQFKTDGPLGNHIGDGTGRGVTHLYLNVLYKSTPDAEGYTSYWINLDSSKKVNSSTTGIGIYKVTLDTNYDYEKIQFRVDIHSDGETTYSYNYWDFKAETGDKATDWSPAPEDVENALSVRPTRTDVNNSISNATSPIYDQITTKIGEANKYTDTEIRDLRGEFSGQFTGIRKEVDKNKEVIRDLETYTTKYKVDAKGLQLNLEKTKGVNFIKNSVMIHSNEFGNGTHANYWCGFNEQNIITDGVIPYLKSNNDQISRTKTQSGSYFSFNYTNNSTVKYSCILSNPIDYKSEANNILLSYKIRQTQAITNGKAFIGLIFYNDKEMIDENCQDVGIITTSTSFQNAYYVPVTEFTSSVLTTDFKEDIIYKTLPISRTKTKIEEEALKVITVYDNSEETSKVIRKYAILTYQPDLNNPIVEIIGYNGTVTTTKANNNKEIDLDISLGTDTVEVKYTRKLNNFVAMDSPTSDKIKVALEHELVTDIKIYYNSSNNKIWIFNPFTGNFIESENIYDNTVTDTNINTIRVIIGVRSIDNNPLKGIIDFSDLKFEYDSISTMWSAHQNEIYGKDYIMDEYGFAITTDNNKMFIDEDEIAAYEKDEQTGEWNADNPVFQIKKEKTILRKTVVHDELLVENTTEPEADAFVMKQQLIGNKWHFIFY